MDDRQHREAEAEPVFRELTRIFGSEPAVAAGHEFVLLPLLGEDEMLAFLRTVPVGTDIRELVALATAYRETYPAPGIVAERDDHEAAG